MHGDGTAPFRGMNMEKYQGYAGQGMPCDAPCHPVVNRHCEGNRGPEDAATAGYLPGDFPHPET
jgi:hypothetical protein